MKISCKIKEYDYIKENRIQVNDYPIEIKIRNNKYKAMYNNYDLYCDGHLLSRTFNKIKILDEINDDEIIRYLSISICGMDVEINNKKVKHYADYTVSILNKNNYFIDNLVFIEM